jgi:hypothetical protein
MGGIMADATPSNWPITKDDLRAALSVSPAEYEDSELELYAKAACERIDVFTGRDVDASKWVLADGSVSSLFVLAARETAKLWWQQSHTVRGSFRQGDVGELSGVPMGAELPRKVEGWLAAYLPEPGIA